MVKIIKYKIINSTEASDEVENAWKMKKAMRSTLYLIIIVFLNIWYK